MIGMGHLKRLERILKYSGTILDFYEDVVELPNGEKQKWDYVFHKRGGGACIVPVLEDGRILMVRQFRPAIDRQTLELPAGAKDDSEATMMTAGRELQEETGYATDKPLIRLASIRSAVAYCNEVTDIYLAQDVHHISEQELDEAEEIRIEIHTLEELLTMISDGTLQDGKTVTGILAYAAYRTVNQ